MDHGEIQGNARRGWTGGNMWGQERRKQPDVVSILSGIGEERFSQNN